MDLGKVEKREEKVKTFFFFKPTSPLNFQTFQEGAEDLHAQYFPLVRRTYWVAMFAVLVSLGGSRKRPQTGQINTT